MEPPKVWREVKQPKGTKICGVCACAMITGKTIDEVLEGRDWRHFTTTRGVALYLAEHGITLGLTLNGDVPLDKECSLRFDMRGRPALVSVKSVNFEGRFHWIVWTGERILDSSTPQPLYEIEDVFPLQFWIESDLPEDLPTDWRAEAAG